MIAPTGRRLPPVHCTWCGHTPHVTNCPDCPCAFTEPVTYSDGNPVQIGDLVRRGNGKATYQVDAILSHNGEPIVSLAPHSGYTSASAFGREISTLHCITDPEGLL